MTEPARILQYKPRPKWHETHLGVGADYRLSAPRTQREAGLEFMQWEDRLPRQRPLWEDVVAGFGLLVFLAIVILMSLAA
jgi:hypothetical protein